ncbi:MAG: DedA family protein [Phycisphaerae bacterium]
MSDSFLFQYLQHAPYVGLFVVLFVAGLGVPLPEDIPLLAAGWLVHKQQAAMVPMIVIGMLGVLVGDTLLYSMGRRYGEHILDHKWLRRVASPWLLQRAEGMFAAHGAKIIFVARFMPGIRSVMFITAGIFRVRPAKFLMIDGSAALVSVPTLIWLGERCGATIDRLAGDVRTAQMVGLAALVLALAGWGAYEYYQVRRRRRIATESRPPAEKAAPPEAVARPPVGAAGSAPVAGRVARRA